MDADIEARFVEAFIIKACRKQALVKLTGNKRGRFFSQLDHHHEIWLDERRMTLIPGTNDNEAFLSRFRAVAAGQADAYVMREGMHRPVDEVKDMMINAVMAQIVIFDASHAFFVPELDSKKIYYELSA